MGVLEGQGSHTCSSSDLERVEAMVKNLPPELKGKLALALLKEVQEEQGAGDGVVSLPQPKGGNPTPVKIGQSSKPLTSPSLPSLTHKDVQTMATSAHLTGGQVRSVMADLRSKFGRGVVEAGLDKEIINLNSRFKDFFTSETKIFLDKNERVMEKPLFFCHRPLEFLKLVAEMRGQTWESVTLLIQGDSGQGWFKLAVSLIHKEDLQDRGARVLERCDISRSIYGISSSPRGARNIEKCNISRSIYGISSNPTPVPRTSAGKYSPHCCRSLDMMETNEKSSLYFVNLEIPKNNFRF
jgi:hypothetical protein